MAINTQTGTSIFVNNGNDTITGIDLSIQYKKQLILLMNKRVALMNATLDNISSIDGGTAIYYVSRRNFTKNYDPNTVASITPDAVHEFQIQVLLDQRKIIQFSVESLDLNQLGAKYEDGNLIVSESFISGWLDARTKSVEAYFYAKLTQLAIATANGTTDPVELDVSDSSKKADVSYLRANVWLPVAQEVARLEGLVTSSYIGLSPEDYTFWVSPRLANYLLLSTTTLGGDSSKKSLETGVIMEIAGIKVMKNPFLGNNYNTLAFDQNEAFDFSSMDGILLHKESIAFPFNNGMITTTVQPETGNLIYIHKFIVNSNGGKALRPSTVVGFKLKTVA